MKIEKAKKLKYKLERIRKNKFKRLEEFYHFLIDKNLTRLEVMICDSLIKIAYFSFLVPFVTKTTALIGVNQCLGEYVLKKQTQFAKA